ncbi:MetQ/NlpA family ABC transporter substrate-binding protein [Anaerotalea alkaliphila]|uniref:Lipoprotein n=1 Tax=Anaerotalea alkaliphila TaxID=2662126 RepID=A0A7X5KMN0_9FIRM|nr:MetQ/NlpA family ABC transporter substrate-binding protein [Anaerotalea alkaliphila]NDL67124.1 MetQ/NlpA family ABC transporter substrate-binding protein [Anaerotalea alkaliphila]
MRRKILLVLALAMVFALPGCGKKESAAAFRIGATPVPHEEILNFVKPILEEKGVAIEIVQFTDYVQPNLALQNEELDANFFQHAPYLEDFNVKNNTQLSSAVEVHFEPLGLFPGKASRLEDLQEGDTVAVPNDTTNEARALLLLEEVGLIKVRDDAGLEATIRDIEENPKNLQFVELEAAQIARSLQDVSVAVINGNYAIEAGLNAATDALASEDKDSLAAQTFANIVAVRTGDQREEIRILKEVLQSEEVRAFLEEKYQGAVVPVF